MNIMSSTLYRKYRPRKFSEILGQNHIVRTLSNAIKHNRVGHAYLFTGPRGTGKTTIARIFAKAINCENLENSEPCLKCDICKNISEGRSLDIIEIDAASNTGVDNIRELRETVKLPPTQAKYKVYIIDEAHMLSQGAFNALLKTLEEPPSHVIFILATTAIHKIPETIISRCQRFDFTRLTLENIIKNLSEIAENEKVKIDKNSLEMIAIAAEGGMRDALSLLAQIIALEDKNITSKEVEEILGTTNYEAVEKMGELILLKNLSGAIEHINRLSDEGYNLEVFSKSLLNYLRQLLLISIDAKLGDTFSLELTREQLEKMKNQSKTFGTKDILTAIDLISEARLKIKSSFIPQLPLELAIVRSINTSPQSIADISQENKQFTHNKKELRIKNNELSETNNYNDVNREIKLEKISSDTKNLVAEESTPKEILVRNNDEPKEQYSNLTLDDFKANWNKFLEEIRPFNHSLNALLSNCAPFRLENNVLTIAVKYSFYKERMSEEQNRLAMEKALGKITGAKIKIKVIDEKEAGIKIPTNNRPLTTDNKKDGNNSLLNDALNIFGGKIMEE